MGKGLRVLSITVMMAICFTAFNIPVLSSEVRKDFRAVWVSTVYDLDYPSKATANPETLKKDADAILDNCVAMGMNAVILQVRPSADAFYPSAYFPWSKYLTGNQGSAPNDGFDPLEYWITQAHARGLELHAWINPYRITTGKEAEYNTLASNHPALLHPDWIIKDTDGNYYFNPGIPEVRKLIEDGAAEIAKNYNVDGIHMDDYFYPTTGFDDSATFAQYGNGISDIGDWRRNNVDLLVQELYTTLHAIKPDISFGISPAGIWANQSQIPEGSATSGNSTYYSHYANTKKWVEEGWVDYICPQIYWNIGYAAADYEILCNWWANVVNGTKVKLYIGMADYLTGNADPNNPWYGISEMQKQVELNRSIPQIQGEVHFRYQFINTNQELKNFYTQEYKEVPPPLTPVLDKVNHNAYMKGDDKGEFCPDANLSRAEAVTIFARLIVDNAGNPAFDPNVSYPSDFSDVNQNEWYASAIGFIQKYGIIKGYSDGTFRPDSPITRAEFAVIAARFYPGEMDDTPYFTDVTKDNFAYYSIGLAKKMGWISGYPDGTFLPGQNIKRAEVVKIVNKMLGREPDINTIDQSLTIARYPDVQKEHWAFYEIMEASVSHKFIIRDNREYWQIVS